MALAIVGSSKKTLELQLLNLLAAVSLVPLFAFLPRTMYDPLHSLVFTALVCAYRTQHPRFLDLIL